MKNRTMNPCAFCEGDAEILEGVLPKGHSDSGFDHGVFVQCVECGARGPAVGTEEREKAIDLWNLMGGMVSQSEIDNIPKLLFSVKLHDDGLYSHDYLVVANSDVFAREGAVHRFTALWAKANPSDEVPKIKYAEVSLVGEINHINFDQ